MITELHHWFDTSGPLTLTLAALAALLALAAAVLLTRRLGRLLRGKKAADVLTVVAAGMASAVAATGMWHFFSRTMHLPVWLQTILFAFMEISVLASALRARANVARDGNAGADGLAVWILTSASGLMSASEAASPQEAFVRLGAPLVAAWLWERSMVPERRARRAAQGAKETAVAWLFSVKRIAVRFGLATALGADLESEDANRRIDRFVRADNRAQRAGFLTRRHSRRRRDRAHARLMEQARMQADPRALYAHLGRQAILDVLARLGGDDAVIDRERARQMQDILTDDTAERPTGPAEDLAENPAQDPAGQPRERRTSGNATTAFAKAFASAAGRAANGAPLTPTQNPATDLPAAPHRAEATLAIPAARQPIADPIPGSAPTAAAGPRPAPRGQGSHRVTIPVEPVRFVAAVLPEPESEPEPDDTLVEPGAESAAAPTRVPSAVIDDQLADRITDAIAASPKLPNLLKLANELGISITQMQDTIDALGGFNAVWNRVRQNPAPEHTDDEDLAFYSA